MGQGLAITPGIRVIPLRRRITANSKAMAARRDITVHHRAITGRRKAMRRLRRIMVRPRVTHRPKVIAKHLPAMVVVLPAAETAHLNDR